MIKLKTLLASNYSTTFATNLVILVSGLVNSIILARILGPEGRGQIAAAVLWPTLWVYLGGFGLTEATLYFSAQSSTPIGSVYSSALVLSLLQSILVIPIGYIFLPAVLAAQSPNVVELSAAFMMSIPFGILLGHHGNIIRARMPINVYNTLTLIIPVGITLGSIVLANRHFLTVNSAVLLQLVLTLLATLVSFLFILANFSVSIFRLDLVTMRHMLNYGIRVYVGTIFSAANLRLDQVLLAAWTTPENLGFYVVAVKVAGIVSILPTVVTTIEVPRMARQPDMMKRVHELTKMFRNFWVANVILKVAFFLVLPYLIPLVYGNTFKNSLLSGEILVIASIFNDAKFVLTGGAQALNAPWIASRAELISSIITILLLVILLPIWGIVGAAVASLAAYGVSMIVLIKTLEIRYVVRMRLWPLK